MAKIKARRGRLIALALNRVFAPAAFGMICGVPTLWVVIQHSPERAWVMVGPLACMAIGAIMLAEFYRQAWPQLKKWRKGHIAPRRPYYGGYSPRHREPTYDTADIAFPVRKLSSAERTTLAEGPDRRGTTDGAGPEGQDVTSAIANVLHFPR